MSHANTADTSATTSDPKIADPSDATVKPGTSHAASPNDAALTMK